MRIHPDLIEVLEGLEKGEVPPTVEPWTKIMARELGKPEESRLGLRMVVSKGNGVLYEVVRGGERGIVTTLPPGEFERILWMVNSSLLEDEEEMNEEKEKWGNLLAPFRVRELEERVRTLEKEVNHGDHSESVSGVP